ncbi:MAG TPA: helix-turn-helix domain-containing protein [Acidimicrobiales bacterium]
MTQPAIKTGTFVDVSDPETLEFFGAAGELLVRELHRDGLELPDTVAGSTLRAVITMRRAQRENDGAVRACAPAIAPHLDCLRSARRESASRDPMPKMLMTRDVAKRLNVTPQRVRQWADSGELAGDKDQLGHWRFPEPAVEVFAMDRNARNAGNPRPK